MTPTGHVSDGCLNYPSLFGGPANFAPFTWGVIAGIITFILEKAGGLDRLIK